MSGLLLSYSILATGFIIIVILIWDCSRREFENPSEKIIWIIIIIFTGAIGQIIYLIIGRKKGLIKNHKK